MNELPRQDEAERAVLGSVLLNRDVVRVINWLQPSDFYSEAHRIIFQASMDLFDKSIEVDLQTLVGRLVEMGKLDSIGGISFLADLSNSVPTSSHAEYYARLVKRVAIQREFIMAGPKITRLAYEPDFDEHEAIQSAYAVIDTIAGDNPMGAEDLVSLGDLIDQHFVEMEKKIEGDETLQYTETSFHDLDQILTGLFKGDFLVLAARPSVGKTSFALSLTYEIAMRGGQVDVYSLEMSKEQYLQRLIAMDAGIDLQNLRNGRLRDSELVAYMKSLGKLHGLPISICDTAKMSVNEIISRTKRQLLLGIAPDLIIIDYLQLMKGDGKFNLREQEVASIARNLKLLARQFNVPVLALAQLSRAVEGRTSHVPMLSDLRESGAIENDADVVMFIYREELYDKDTDKQGIAEIHIAKHRQGPIGVVPMRFEKQTTRFQNLSYRDLEGY